MTSLIRRDWMCRKAAKLCSECWRWWAESQHWASVSTMGGWAGLEPRVPSALPAPVLPATLHCRRDTHLHTRLLASHSRPPSSLLHSHWAEVDGGPEWPPLPAPLVTSKGAPGESRAALNAYPPALPVPPYRHLRRSATAPGMKLLRRPPLPLLADRADKS